MPNTQCPPDGPGDASVRRARPADAERLGAFLVPTWLDAHHGQVPEEVWRRRRAEWTPEVSSAAWRRTLGEIEATSGHPSSVLLAEDASGRVVGLGMVTVVGDGSAAVDALYVDADRHGTGLGRSLLAAIAAIAAADGAGSVDIRVLAANRPARDFYEHLGGRVAGEAVVDDDGVELAAVHYRWDLDQLAEEVR